MNVSRKIEKMNIKRKSDHFETILVCIHLLLRNVLFKLNSFPFRQQFDCCTLKPSSNVSRNLELYSQKAGIYFLINISVNAECESKDQNAKARARMVSD